MKKPPKIPKNLWNEGGKASNPPQGIPYSQNDPEGRGAGSGIVQDFHGIAKNGTFPQKCGTGFRGGAGTGRGRRRERVDPGAGKTGIAAGWGGADPG